MLTLDDGVVAAAVEEDPRGGVVPAVHDVVLCSWIPRIAPERTRATSGNTGERRKVHTSEGDQA